MGVVLQLGLLRGCGGHCIAVRVVAWPRFVSWALLLRGHSERHVAVMFVVWPWWVLSHCIVSRVLSLCGCGGHHIMLPRWVSSCCVLCRRHRSCIAAVGIMLCSHGGCCCAAFCVMGAVIMWPW